MNPRFGYGSFVASQIKTFSSTTRHLHLRDEVNRRSKQAVRHSFISQPAACLVVSDATKTWEKTYPIDATTVATRSGRTVTLIISITRATTTRVKKRGTRRKQYRFKCDDVAKRFMGRWTAAVAAPALGDTQGPGLDPATRRRIAAPESKKKERRLDATTSRPNITSTRVLNITVDIGRGRPPQEIHVHDDDVHLELADAFVVKHGLVPDMVPILCSHITRLVSLEATGASVSAPSAVETTAADVAAGETKDAEEGSTSTTTAGTTSTKDMKDTGGTTSTKDAAGTKDKQRTVVIGVETQDVLGLRDVEHAREVMTHLSVADFKTEEKTGALRLCFSDRKHRVEALVWIQDQVMVLKKARLREDETEMTETEDEGDVVKEDEGRGEQSVGGMDEDTNVDVRLFYYGIGCIPPLPDTDMAVAEPFNTKVRGGPPTKYIIDARAITTARLTLETAAPFVEAAGILDSRHFYYRNTAADYTCDTTSVGIQKNVGGTRPPVIDTTKSRPKPSTGRDGEDNGEHGRVQEEVPLPVGDVESSVVAEAVARPAQQSPDQGWSGLRTWQEKRARHRGKSKSSPRAKHMERSQSLSEEIVASALSNISPSPQELTPCVIIAKEDGKDRHQQAQQEQRKQALQDRQTQHEEEQQVHRLQHDDDSSMYSSSDEALVGGGTSIILQRIVNANTEVALAAAMEALLAASRKPSTKKDRGDGEGGNEDGGEEAEEKQLDFNEAIAASRTKMAQDHIMWSSRIASLFRQYLMSHSLARAALAADEESRRSSAAFRRRQPVARRRQTMNSDGEETDSSVMSSHLGEEACGGDVSEDISVESSRLVHIMGDDISVASSIQSTAHSTVLDGISVTPSFQSTLLDNMSVASDGWLEDDPILGRMFRDTEAALLSAIPTTDSNGDHDGDGEDGSDGGGGGDGGDTSASGVISVNVASDDGGGGGRRSGGGAVGTIDTGASPVETRRLLPQEEEATKKRESPKVNFARHGRVHSTKLGRKLLNLSKKHNAEWGSTLTTTLSAVGKLMGPVRRMRAARNALNGVSGGDREVGRASGGVVPGAVAAEGHRVDETKLALTPHGADKCGASPLIDALGSGVNTGVIRD
jgi:hypothetical protein